MRLLCAVAINGEMQNAVNTEVRLGSAFKTLPAVIRCEVHQRGSFFVKRESLFTGQAISTAAEITNPALAVVATVEVT